MVKHKTKPLPGLYGPDYQRTHEDEENDRREREWKKRRNEEALRSLRTQFPTGRVFPRGK